MFVPTKIFPPEMTGLPYVCEPSLVDQRTPLVFGFARSDGSNVVGSPRASDTMFRSSDPPHCGQSAAPQSEARLQIHNKQPASRFITVRIGVKQSE